MKTLIINGSPRTGNSKRAAEIIAAGIKEKNAEAEIEIVDTYSLNIKPCTNCNICSNGNGCIQKDDSNIIINKVLEADSVIFTSPVYYFGISAQLKLIIDKFYSKNAELMEQPKKLGLVAVGAGELSDAQYTAIKAQFDCLCSYLKWDFSFFHAISAYEAEDFKKDSESAAELLSKLK